MLEHHADTMGGIVMEEPTEQQQAAQQKARFRGGAGVAWWQSILINLVPGE